MEKFGAKRYLRNIAAVLVVCCIVAMVVSYAKKTYDLLYQEAKDNISIICQQEAERLALLFHGEISLTQQMAKTISEHMQHNNQSALQAAEETFRTFDDYLGSNSIAMGIELIDQYHWHVDTQGALTHTPEKEELIKKGFAGKLAISPPFFDEVNQQEAVNMVAPVMIGDSVPAVVCAQVLTNSLYAPGSAAVFEGQGYSFLVDQEGGVVMKLANCADKVLFDNFFDHMAENRQNDMVMSNVQAEIHSGIGGIAEVWDIDGEKKLLFYYPVDQENGWTLVLMAPESIVIANANMKQVIGIAAAVYAVTMFLVVALILLVSHQRRKQNEYVEQLAFHDKLTGIPNKNYFELCGEQLLSTTFNEANSYAVVVFDVENFNIINELNGYHQGDWVLCRIAQILQERVADEEEIYREYNDVFGMLLVYTDNQSLNQWLMELFQEINHVVSIENGSIGNLEFCCGVYLVEDPTISLQLMLDWANMARKRIKGQTVNYQIAYYDADMRQQLLEEKELECELDAALEKQEIIPYFQPKIDLDKEEICGAEALVRWKRGETMLQPGVFVPIFERDGQIDKVDFYIFEAICKLKQQWRAEGRKNIIISVNMSRNHLNQNDFVDQLVEIANRYQVPLNELEIEMTETLFFKDNMRLIEVMKRIKMAGFQLAIDDFGTGYSSLNLLKEIPADVLKLDRGFFGDLQSVENNSQCIIRHVVSMANDLNMQVVSEGVESQDQVEFLRSIGCRVAQGYYYARPMPVEMFESTYLQSNTDEASPQA